MLTLVFASPTAAVFPAIAHPRNSSVGTSSASATALRRFHSGNRSGRAARPVATGHEMVCGAISLRRHYPDQVLGVAVQRLRRRLLSHSVTGTAPRPFVWSSSLSRLADASRLHGVEKPCPGTKVPARPGRRSVLVMAGDHPALGQVPPLHLPVPPERGVARVDQVGIRALPVAHLPVRVLRVAQDGRYRPQRPPLPDDKRGTAPRSARHACRDARWCAWPGRKSRYGCPIGCSAGLGGTAKVRAWARQWARILCLPDVRSAPGAREPPASGARQARSGRLAGPWRYHASRLICSRAPAGDALPGWGPVSAP